MWITRVSINNPVFATMVMVGIAVLGHLFVQPAARRADARRQPAVRARADRAIPARRPRSSRPTSPSRSSTRSTRSPASSLIRSNSTRGPEPGVRRVPDVDRHDAGDAGRARQDRAGPAGLPARRQGPAGHPRRPGEPAAGGVARRDVADDEPARPHLAHRPDDRQGARERAGRRAHRRQRPRDAADPHPDQAERADGARHRRRPGDQRDPRGEPGRPGGPHHARRRPTRSCASRARSRIRRSSARIIVAQQGGAPVYLSQVADVIDGEKEQDSIARINGRPSITLDIQKAQDANIVETGRGVNEAVAALKKRLPPDVELRSSTRPPTQVEKSVNRVKQTIVEGALLTVLIVFLFLHSWRSTIITGLTLPIAVIATFIALNAFGFTLNFLTLMALSLCIGLLIDDAIVVRENIVRHLGHGQGPPDRGAGGHRRDRARGDGDDLRDRRGVRARSRS